MRTTLEIDDTLLNEVVALTNAKTKGKAVNKALEEFLRRRRIEELREMLGTMDLVDNWYELRHAEPR
jgi:Arc/MetJ family transcription regulator